MRSLELWRNGRQIRSAPVRVWELITPDTVDVTVMGSLDAKQELSRRTVDEIRRMLA